MQRQYHDPYAYYGQEQDPAQAAAAGAQSQQDMASLQQQALQQQNMAQEQALQQQALQQPIQQQTMRPGVEIRPEERLAIWAGLGALLGFFVGPQLLGLRGLTGAVLGGAGGFYVAMEKEKRAQAKARAAALHQIPPAVAIVGAPAPLPPAAPIDPPAPDLSFLEGVMPPPAAAPPVVAPSPVAPQGPVQGFYPTNGGNGAAPPDLQTLNGGSPPPQQQQQQVQQQAAQSVQTALALLR